jgi:hypothetical protein
MLKKILVSGLIGSVLLSLPLSVQAKIVRHSTGSSRTNGAVIAQNSLSASEQQAIRQLFLKTLKALNSGTPGEVISAYSPNYQDNSSSSAGSYQNLKSTMRMALAFMRAYGVSITANNIQIQGDGQNRAAVTVNYKVDISPEIIAEMTPEQRQQYQKNPGKTQGQSLFTVEKTNGRWLIVSTKDLSGGNIQSLPVAGGTMTISDAAPAKGVSASAQDRKAVKSLFARHLQTLNKEDLKNYLATLDSKSSKYEQVKQQTTQLFKDYDLKYELKSLEIVSLNNSSGVVKMVANVKRLRGASFNDSKVVTYNTVHKTKGTWQISDTEVESLTALR